MTDKDDGRAGYRSGGRIRWQPQRRRVAALRLPVLVCSRCGQGHRDPWAKCRPHDVPGDFGLSASELWAEIGRCQRAGWQGWEIRRRLADPRGLVLPEGVGR